MTSFHCTMCGACCRNLGNAQSVLLLEQDIQAIAEARGLSPKAVREDFCQPSTELSRRAGRTLLELKSNAGACVFLSEANVCTIHDHKPMQCRLAPERFLPRAMKQDYECMRDVVVDSADDMTEVFFSSLMETKYG